MRTSPSSKKERECRWDWGRVESAPTELNAFVLKIILLIVIKLCEFTWNLAGNILLTKLTKHIFTQISISLLTPPLK